MPTHGRRVYGGGVTHIHGQVGILHTGTAKLHLQCRGIDTWRGEAEASNEALHTDIIDEIEGIDMCVVQSQLVQHDVAAKQRAQLHVDNSAADIGNGVLFLHDTHTVNLQVEGKAQIHMLHTDFQSRLLRSDGCHLLRHPVLYGRHIEQCYQHDKQYNGTE